MQTSLKKLAATLWKAPLARTASRTVCGQQGGFLPDRVLRDNLIAVKAAMQEFSLTGRTPACILLDFFRACPSLAHGWLWRVLRAIGLSVGLQNTVKAMYDELETLISHMGCPHQRMRI